MKKWISYIFSGTLFGLLLITGCANGMSDAGVMENAKSVSGEASRFVDTNAVSTFRVSDPDWFKGKKYYCVKQLVNGEEISFLEGSSEGNHNNPTSLYIEFDSTDLKFATKESHENDGGNHAKNNSGNYTFNTDKLTGVMTCTSKHTFYEDPSETGKMTEFPFTLSEDGKTLTFPLEITYNGQKGTYTYIWKLTGKYNQIESGNTLWSNNSGTDFAYWTNTDNRWIRLSKKGFNANDKIIISYKRSPSFSAYQTIQLAGAYHQDWGQTFLREGSVENAYTVAGGGSTITEYNIVPYDEDEGKIVYKLTASDAAIINSNYGLAVYGCGVSITKVECSNLVANSVETITPENSSQEIHTGTFDLGNWNNYLKLYYKNFSAGDKIYVTHTASSSNPPNKDDLNCFFKMTGLHSSNWDRDALCNLSGLINAYIQENGIHPVSNSQTTVYTLTKNDAATLNAYNGIAIWGGAITITNIKVYASNTLETSLVSYDNYSDGVTVFEGRNDLGGNPDKSWVSDNFIPLQFTGFSEGDEIRIKHTSSSYEDYYKLKFKAYRSDKWDDDCLKRDNALVNAKMTYSDGSIEPVSINQWTAYKLNAAEAAMLNRYEGILLFGCGLTITKIVLKTSNTLCSASYKNGWIEEGIGTGYDFSGGSRTLHFNQSFYSYKMKDKSWSQRLLDSENFKEFEFEYTFDPNTGTLLISKVYEITYALENGGINAGTKSQINGVEEFTATWTEIRGSNNPFYCDAGIKFNSVPVTGDLNKYFIENVWYSFSENPEQYVITIYKDSPGEDYVYYYNESTNEYEKPKFYIDQGDDVELTIDFNYYPDNHEPALVDIYYVKDGEREVKAFSNVPVSEGKINFNTSAIPAGEYGIFARAGRVDSNRKTYVVQSILPKSISLTQPGSNVISGNNAEININFSNFRTDPAAVEVHLNSQVIDSVTVTNGKITIPTTGLSAGNYTAYAKANGITSNSITVTVVVPAITLPSTAISVNQDSSFTITPTFAYFDQIPSSLTACIDNNEVTSVINPSTGQITLSTNGLSAGEHTIYVRTGSINSNTRTFTVVGKSIIISVSLTTVKQGFNFTITPVFTNFSSNPSSVNVYMDNELKGVFEINSSTGKVTYNTAGLSVGSHTLKVVSNDVESNSINLTISDPPSINITTSQTTFTSGEDIIINLSFNNFTSNPSSVNVYAYNDICIHSNKPVINETITLSSSGLSLGTNDFYVKSGTIKSNKISLTINSPEPEPELIEYDETGIVIFDGSNDFGVNNSSRTRLRFQIGNFREGDIILVTHTSSSTISDAPWFKLYGGNRDPASSSMTTGEIKNATISNSQIYPELTSQTTEYTLTEIDASYIDDLHNAGAGCLGIEGSGLTITKIVVKRANKNRLLNSRYVLNGWVVAGSSKRDTSGYIVFTREETNLSRYSSGTDCSELVKFFEFEWTKNGGTVIITKISDVPLTIADNGGIIIHNKRLIKGTPTKIYEGNWDATLNTNTGTQFNFVFHDLPDELKQLIICGVYYPM